MEQKVYLIAHTPFPQKTVASAAKLCYSPSGIEGLMDSITDEGAAKFVEMLSGLGHDSPTEHVSFTFGIEGVSRSLTHQLVRHRIASYSQQSQRYVTESTFEYIVPPEIAGIPKAAEEFIRAMEEDKNHYERLTKLLYKKHYNTLINDGENEKEALKKAEKMAIEDARYVLPNACETKLIMTMNVRSLKNFFSHRLCSRAQWEIRELAEKMLFLVKNEAPELFSNCGPSCVNGACPEGKLSCGKASEMRKKYGRKV